jgi:transposase-like protein
MSKRKRHSAEFKAKIALEAAKGIKTINEIASEHSVHPVQISKWKKELTDGLPGIWLNDKAPKSDQKLIDSLYQQIGQLKVELDWLKKKLC